MRDERQLAHCRMDSQLPYPPSSIRLSTSSVISRGISSRMEKGGMDCGIHTVGISLLSQTWAATCSREARFAGSTTSMLAISLLGERERGGTEGQRGGKGERGGRNGGTEGREGRERGGTEGQRGGKGRQRGETEGRDRGERQRGETEGRDRVRERSRERVK